MGPRGFLRQLFSARSFGCRDVVSCDAGCDCVPVHGVQLNDHALEVEVTGSAPFEDEVEVVTLSEEFLAQYFVGDTVNLAALSKAVNVSHEFLAGYVFEHGFGEPVEQIQAAAAAIAFEIDQLAMQAVAAREAEVSGFFFFKKKKNSAPRCKKRYSSL